jgi:hypothetical protein
MRVLIGDVVETPVPIRPKKSKEDLVQEFWSEIGFPTPASRFWERGSSSSPAATGDLACVSVCRTRFQANGPGRMR